MPDPEPDPTPDPEPDPDPKPGEVFDEERAKAKIAKANSEAQGLRKRLKELEEKASKLDELENASKTEQQKLTEQVAALEARAAKAEADHLRLSVGAEKGLSPAQARRLLGTTKEELEADADELLTSFKPADERPGGRPREALRGGGAPNEDPEIDVKKIVESIPRY